MVPVASYGTQVIWEHVFIDRTYERIKLAFLKCAVGLHRSLIKGYTYFLGNAPLFIKDLQRRITSAYLEFISVRKTNCKGGRAKVIGFTEVCL